MVDNRKAGERLSWFVLSTRSNAEFSAAEKVAELGYQTFVPTEGRYRRRSRYAKEKDLQQFPLMPSYVFFASPANERPRWFDVLTVEPVIGVISAGGQPATVRESVVDELMLRHVKQEFQPPECQKFMKSGHEFAVGDLCEILAGPFRGNEVTVEKIKGNAASVMMELFGGRQAVKISLDLLSLKK